MIRDEEELKIAKEDVIMSAKLNDLKEGMREKGMRKDELPIKYRCGESVEGSEDGKRIE